MQPPIGTVTLAIAACMPFGWVRGGVEIGRNQRLVDVLNHPTPWLALLSSEVLPFGTSAWPEPRALLSLYKPEIRFLHPVAGITPHSPGPDPYAERFPVPVGMYVADFYVEATLNMVDRLPWLEFLTLQRARFVTLTAATIHSAQSGTTVLTADVLAVNRDHVSTFFEL